MNKWEKPCLWRRYSTRHARVTIAGLIARYHPRNRFGPGPRNPCVFRRNSSTSCARGFRFRKSSAGASKLKKAGREWKGLSPFNKEKTPSFFVNDQKAAWFDFSSGKNGNIFDFLMLTEGVTFPRGGRAARRRGGRAAAEGLARGRGARGAARSTLHDVVELAAKFFEATLPSRGGAKARGYLADRGLDPATQLQFRIGYAPPERFALKEHLGGQGVSVEDMIEAGLLVAATTSRCPTIASATA